MITLRRKPQGYWTGPGFAKHHCRVPGLRVRGLPFGSLVFRCECGNEWRWSPR